MCLLEFRLHIKGGLEASRLVLVQQPSLFFGVKITICKRGQSAKLTVTTFCVLCVYLVSFFSLHLHFYCFSVF